MISIVVISKDESSLDVTLSDVVGQAEALEMPTEVIVVDASDGRLDSIRIQHASQVRWLQFEQPPGVRVSIPHQRNVGVGAANGETIVFTDAGCRPERDWLARLVAPLFAGEFVTVGLALATPGSSTFYDRSAQQAFTKPYLKECATINLAFRREAFDAVGGFDESFAYGSDADFSWRLIDAGYRLRSVPDAVVRHDWGSLRRRMRRSYVYGRARMRLYMKHRNRRKYVLRDNPPVVVYPLFLLGLPVMLLFFISPVVLLYPVLLIIPAWRNRVDGPVAVVVDHLIHGLGGLAELFDEMRGLVGGPQAAVR